MKTNRAVPLLGTVVKSISGRDGGSFYMIVAKKNENFVYIADGRIRKLSSPKLKNKNHLNFLNEIIDIDKINLTDKKIREILHKRNFPEL